MLISRRLPKGLVLALIAAFAVLVNYSHPRRRNLRWRALRLKANSLDTCLQFLSTPSPKGVQRNARDIVGGDGQQGRGLHSRHVYWHRAQTGRGRSKANMCFKVWALPEDRYIGVEVLACVRFDTLRSGPCCEERPLATTYACQPNPAVEQTAGSRPLAAAAHREASAAWRILDGVAPYQRRQLVQGELFQRA